jgi:hypothetical protein
LKYVTNAAGVKNAGKFAAVVEAAKDRKAKQEKDAEIAAAVAAAKAEARAPAAGWLAGMLG